MQRLLIKRPFYLLALLGFALVVTIAWWSMRPAIFLTAGDEWHDLGHAYSGRSVVIHYRHSVQQTHVWEYLTVNDTADGFVLRSTKYKSYDVGLPFCRVKVISEATASIFIWIILTEFYPAR